MTSAILLAVPNVSEGRDAEAISAIADAFGGGEGVRLIDVHSDADHHRSVFTIAGPPPTLADAILAGARATLARVNVVSDAAAPPERSGKHPHVGALDVAPVVYTDARARGAACAEALVVADRIGEELAVPVFLYGELTAEEPAAQRTRAQLRRGGVLGLEQRMQEDPPSARLHPDFGPARLHPSAGATLVAARPPLVAFNLQLREPATVADAHRIAGLVREHGVAGVPGLRAIGIELAGGVAQVSMNVERPFDVSLAEIVHAVAAHVEVASAEIVGLAPEAALDGFPRDLPLVGFDGARQVIENALGS